MYRYSHILKNYIYRIILHLSAGSLLNTIPVKDFKRCYQKRRLLHRCVAAQGDNIDV